MGESPGKTGVPPGTPFPPPTAPYDVAKQLYEGCRDHDGVRNLVRYRGDWMLWRMTHWAEVDDAEVRSRIYRALEHAVYVVVKNGTPQIVQWAPTRHKVANVLEAMAAIGHLSSDTDTPAWIDLHSAKLSADRVISCQNGLLDLDSRTLHDHTPALFNFVTVPFAYNVSAPEPAAWLEFLASIWGDDADSIALLQEFFGYVLSGRMDMQKMLLLIGPIRGGKGTIARILTDLMGGRRNVPGPTLTSLGTNFGVSPLIGKPLAIIADARLGNQPSHTVVQQLLSITGEDTLTVDRKYRDPWTGKLPTRFLMLTNELPKFRDSSTAIATRMLILRMTNSFLNREDYGLETRLRPELPGILQWSLAGLDRLNRQGRFTVPASSADMATMMSDLASPVSAFVRDRCERRPGAQVARDVLYEAWKEWAQENGHHPGAKSTFGRDLRAAVPELGQLQPRINGRQVWFYTHVGVIPVSPVSDTSRWPEMHSDTDDPVSDSDVIPVQHR